MTDSDPNSDIAPGCPDSGHSGLPQGPADNCDGVTVPGPKEGEDTCLRRADDCLRRADDAKQRAAQATEPTIKSAYEKVAEHWMLLARLESLLRDDNKDA
jgi:hypothetical protein